MGEKNAGALRKAKPTPKLNGRPERVQHSGTLRKEVTLGGMLALCVAPIDVTEGGTPRARPPLNEKLCAPAATLKTNASTAMSARRITKVYTRKDALIRIEIRAIYKDR